MRKKVYLGLLGLLLVVLLGGCTPQILTPRVPGLAPEDTVKAFFSAVQANHLADASQYVSPEFLPKSTDGDNGSEIIADLKDQKLVHVKEAANQGNYAVVVATLQAKDGFAVKIKPIGLEKISGEWYLVDINKIYQSAKYEMLLKMLFSL